MREVRLQLNGLVCEAQLCDGKRNVLSETKVELDGPTNWLDLLVRIGSQLNLKDHPPPGLVTESDQAADKSVRAPLEAWQAALCGFGMPGFGWGFWLPGQENEKAVRLAETCCGFRDEAGAVKAAKFLRHNLDVITGDLPGGVFEIFGLTGTWAFLDLHGDVHASFPTREEARGCAAKLEAVQMQNVKP